MIPFLSTVYGGLQLLAGFGGVGAVVGLVAGLLVALGTTLAVVPSFGLATGALALGAATGSGALATSDTAGWGGTAGAMV